MLDSSKYKPVVEVLSDRTENIVGKGKKAGYQHFLLFPQCFQKPSSQSGSVFTNPSEECS